VKNPKPKVVKPKVVKPKVVKPKVVSRAKTYAIMINAGNDRNGNPRRGWLVYNADGRLLGFVDHAHVGRSALRDRFPQVVELGTIPTTPGAYRDAMKQELH
jgi:hypothetical protein